MLFENGLVNIIADFKQSLYRFFLFVFLWSFLFCLKDGASEEKRLIYSTLDIAVF